MTTKWIYHHKNKCNKTKIYDHKRDKKESNV